MNINEIITKRIREARKERGLTQQDIAVHLGRTAAAISDLERGKVQVSANDLYIIAKLLNKPIEFFFGEEYGGKDVQDLIAIIRRQSSNARTQSIEFTTRFLRLQELGDDLNTYSSEQISEEQIQKFLDNFVPLSTMINSAAKQLNDMQDKIFQELESQGVDLSKFLKIG
jgi:transcriptional regulator with XRE-family HTH domain